MQIAISCKSSQTEFSSPQNQTQAAVAMRILLPLPPSSIITCLLVRETVVVPGQKQSSQQVSIQLERKPVPGCRVAALKILLRKGAGTTIVATVLPPRPAMMLANPLALNPRFKSSASFTAISRPARSRLQLPNARSD